MLNLLEYPRLQMGHVAAWVRDFIFIGAEAIREEKKPIQLNSSKTREGWNTIGLKLIYKSESGGEEAETCGFKGKLVVEDEGEIMSYGNDVQEKALAGKKQHNCLYQN